MYLKYNLSSQFKKFIHLPKDATENLTLPLSWMGNNIPVRNGHPRSEPQIGLESGVILQVFS